MSRSYDEIVTQYRIEAARAAEVERHYAALEDDPAPGERTMICPRCEGSGLDPAEYLPEACGDCGGVGTRTVPARRRARRKGRTA